MADFFIVGGGPAGLASAIFLSKKGYKVEIYEKNSTLEQSLEESYPIGVNPRGMSVLEEIENLYDDKNNEGLMGLEDIKKEVIEGWDIHMGGWKVASVNSGTTCSATRGGVVKRLYHIARKEENISFFFSHKLQEVDFEKKVLYFGKEGKEGEERVIVEGGKGRVIAGDGVWSKCRRELERHLEQTEQNNADDEPAQNQHQKATMHPWGVNFRVLFSTPNPDIPISPTYHHIFKGCYVAVVEPGPKRWVACVQLKDNVDVDLMGNDASEENVEKLKAHLKAKIPFAENMFSEEEYRKFFGRRMFTGAVVHSSYLQYNDWVVLLGDSSHSVLPATGEGVNAALEDASVLSSCFPPADNYDSNNDHTKPFELYEHLRLPDTQALTNYAKFLLGGWEGGGRERAEIERQDRENRRQEIERKTSYFLSLALIRLGGGLGLLNERWPEKSFGEEAREVVAYREMYREWDTQTMFCRKAGGFVGGAVGWVSSWFV